MIPERKLMSNLCKRDLGGPRRLGTEANREAAWGEADRPSAQADRPWLSPSQPHLLESSSTAFKDAS